MFNHRAEALKNSRTSCIDILNYFYHVYILFGQSIIQSSQCSFSAKCVSQYINLRLLFFLRFFFLWLIWNFGVNVIIWVFIYSIIGQMHKPFIEVRFSRRFVLGSAEPRQPLITNISLYRVNSKHHHINSQIKLNPS